MTDVNSPAPFRSFGGYLTNDTVALAPSAVAGTATSVALAFATDVDAGTASNSAGRPEGEFTVDVLNGCSGLISVAFGHGAAAALTPLASPTSYVMAANERRSFLVPPNTNFFSINPAAASETGSAYATAGRGRA